jgi:hypothetical protein
MHKRALPVLLSAALLSGCGTAAATVPAVHTPAVKHAIPAAGPGRQHALLTELAKINPLLINDEVMADVASTCTGIASGAEGLLTVTRIRFTGPRMDSVSDDEARRILAAISNTGFCTGPARL